MNELEFRNWLINNGTSKKVTCDVISRLKRIERELDHCDIDVAYHNDRCERLLLLFRSNGDNDEMKHYETSLPIGKYSMSTYRYALRLYIRFCES